MNILSTIGIGIVMGAIDGGGIFFAKEEPYKIEIFIAATLKGALVSLLTAYSLTVGSTWWHGLLLGALFGLLFAIVVFLAKGGFKSKDAPYVVPSGIVMGSITGVLLWAFVF
jgi:hypothetical protein